MKFAPLLLSLLVVTSLGGCEKSTPPPSTSATKSEQKTTVETKIPDLGDQIASLSNIDATELSKYLSDIHGIVSAGRQSNTDDNIRRQDSFDAKIVALGDRIASLSLADSIALSEYLATKHGISADK